MSGRDHAARDRVNRGVALGYPPLKCVKMRPVNSSNHALRVHESRLAILSAGRVYEHGKSEVESTQLIVSDTSRPRCCGFRQPSRPRQIRPRFFHERLKVRPHRHVGLGNVRGFGRGPSGSSDCEKHLGGLEPSEVIRVDVDENVIQMNSVSLRLPATFAPLPFPRA